jgi:predicted ATPase
MAIHEIHIAGYRSLVNLRLLLGQLTVVHGQNGTGKSNIYKALRLLSRLAEGQFAKAVAEEGGMNSLLWAGNDYNKSMTTVTAGVQHTRIFPTKSSAGSRLAGQRIGRAFFWTLT